MAAATARSADARRVVAAVQIQATLRSTIEKRDACEAPADGGYGDVGRRPTLTATPLLLPSSPSSPQSPVVVTRAAPAIAPLGGGSDGGSDGGGHRDRRVRTAGSRQFGYDEQTRGARARRRRSFAHTVSRRRLGGIELKQTAVIRASARSLRRTFARPLRNAFAVGFQHQNSSYERPKCRKNTAPRNEAAAN